MVCWWTWKEYLTHSNYRLNKQILKLKLWNLYPLLHAHFHDQDNNLCDFCGYTSTWRTTLHFSTISSSCSWLCGPFYLQNLHLKWAFGASRARSQREASPLQSFSCDFLLPPTAYLYGDIKENGVTSKHQIIKSIYKGLVNIETNLKVINLWVKAIVAEMLRLWHGKNWGLVWHFCFLVAAKWRTSKFQLWVCFIAEEGSIKRSFFWALGIEGCNWPLGNSRP